jgi:hypothetical protein
MASGVGGCSDSRDAARSQCRMAAHPQPLPRRMAGSEGRLRAATRRPAAGARDVSQQAKFGSQAGVVRFASCARMGRGSPQRLRQLHASRRRVASLCCFARLCCFETKRLTLLPAHRRRPHPAGPLCTPVPDWPRPGCPSGRQRHSTAQTGAVPPSRDSCGGSGRRSWGW